MNQQTLTREIGVFGATMMGLGSIIGTGVFVTIGTAAGIAGSAVLLAISIAAMVAVCNALSSAQLAACHPVSGGTYEYGYRFLNPWMGFSAGWLFLLAKSASGATAALGFSGYLINLTGMEPSWQKPIAAATVISLTTIVISGIRLSSRVNTVIVGITLCSLAAFVIGGLPELRIEKLTEQFDPSSLAHATALFFVAYTGYGRIATLGEEVRDPRRTIPRAIIATLLVSMFLYASVAIIAVGTAGAAELASVTQQRSAPLETVAREFRLPVAGIVAVGAMTAMLGVLLNLLLGLSRVLLAMGRRGDMPRGTQNIRISVLTCGAVTLLLAITGSVKTTWSFSAFTVLIYYSVTNAAALKLPPDARLYPRFLAWGGLIACVFLAFSLEQNIWLPGIGALVIGLLWHTLASVLRHRRI